MSKIALSGNASGTGTFTIASPGTNTDRTLTLPDATGTVVYADANGNVGIGTTSPDNVPSYKGLTLSGTSGGFVFAKSTTGSITAEMSADDGVTASKFGSRTNHPVLLISNGIERVRIDTAGRVTMPYQPHILGSPRNTSGAGIANAFFTRQSTGLSWGGDRITVPVAGRYLVTFMSITEQNSNRWDTSLWVNGVVLISALNDLATGYHSRSIVATVALAANDYLQFSNEQWYNASSANWEEWRTVSVTLLG
jgi:hypothetical protein